MFSRAFGRISFVGMMKPYEPVSRTSVHQPMPPVVVLVQSSMHPAVAP